MVVVGFLRSGTPATVDGPPVSGVLHALSVWRPTLCTGWICCSVAPPGFTAPVMRVRAAGRLSTGTAGRVLQSTGSDPLAAVVIRRAGERGAAPLGLRRPSRHGDRHESRRGDPRVVGVPVPVRYCDRGGRECLPSRREHMAAAAVQQAGSDARTIVLSWRSRAQICCVFFITALVTLVLSFGTRVTRLVQRASERALAPGQGHSLFYPLGGLLGGLAQPAHQVAQAEFC
jgi:hypothetical protein